MMPPDKAKEHFIKAVTNVFGSYDEHTLPTIAETIEFILYAEADSRAQALEILDKMFHSIRKNITTCDFRDDERGSTH